MTENGDPTSELAVSGSGLELLLRAGRFSESVGAVEWVIRNELTAIIEQDDPWYVAYCAEVPGANVQGKTQEECLANLRAAIALILEHRREESLRALPPDAKQELVVVG